MSIMSKKEIEMEVIDALNFLENKICKPHSPYIDSIGKPLGHLELSDGTVVEVQLSLVIDGDGWVDSNFANQVFGDED